MNFCFSNFSTIPSAACSDFFEPNLLTIATLFIFKNGVTDELFARLSEYWSEEEIVEILGVVCMFGIFNRWNDSMATPLEDEAIEVGTRLLGPSDWTIGKHV